MFTTPILKPSDLGLILSYKCQSNCAHCLYNCGRGWEEWISTVEIDQALQATQAWKHPFQVHITGGEPFLNFPLLKHAVKTCAELGIPVYVETNAGWCVNPELTRRRFAELKEIGLLAVLVSCSPFHAEHIPPERVLRAVEQAADIFSARGVIVYLEDWLAEVASKGLTATTPLEVYADEYGAAAAGQLFWQGYGLISGGRAGYRLGHLIESYAAEEFRRDRCRGELLFAPHSHFDLYGNFIPGFCGGISLGSWHELPQLTDRYRAGQFPPLIGTLIEQGPYGLYPLAAQNGYTQLPGGYAGKCHLCVDLRRHLHAAGSSTNLQPAGFYSQLINIADYRY
jgi:hypothetical protein